jgi:hypothetical protein
MIEGRKERTEFLANELKDAYLLGDATDEELLEQENIAEMDLFLAVTNDDEDNIMSGSLAKRLGCKRVVALINRRAYAEMIEGGPIDIGISPAQVRSVPCWRMSGRAMWPKSIRCAGAPPRRWNCCAWRCQNLQGDRQADRSDRLAARGDGCRTGTQL